MSPTGATDTTGAAHSTGANGDTDVLVIGGGPGGIATALVLARRGRSVTVVDRADRPGPEACNGLLTPRALAELDLLDVAPSPGLEIAAITVRSDEHELTRPWPARAGLPATGLVVDRRDLGEALIDRARSAGVTVLAGHTATEPIVERGFVRGAAVVDPTGATAQLRCRYLVTADGATSRFGRSIGTVRRTDWPFVASLSNTWRRDGATPARSPEGAGQTDVVELHLGLTDRDGEFVAGVGWVVPTTDGHVHISTSLWSTTSEFGVLSGNEMLGALAERVASTWGIDPASPLGAADGSRIPVGGSVVPVAGPAHLVVGDAAGVANPFTAAGIESALWSGRLAGGVLAEALEGRDPTVLQRYPSMLAGTTGGYYKVGRLATRLAGHRRTSRLAARAASRHRHVADAVLRIGLQHLRRHGGPETAYRAARAASRFGPAA